MLEGEQMLKDLTIMIFIVAVFLILFPKYKGEWIKKHKILKVIFDKELVDFIINICVTAIGVTLAIFLTNYDVEEQDAEETIALLTSLDCELESIENYIDEIYFPFYETFEENQWESGFFEFYNEVPVHPIANLEVIMEDKLIIVNTNSFTYESLIESQHSINNTYGRLEEVQDAKSIIRELESLRKTVELMHGVIKNEIRFQSDEIQAEDMENAINQIYERIYTEE